MVLHFPARLTTCRSPSPNSSLPNTSLVWTLMSNEGWAEISAFPWAEMLIVSFFCRESTDSPENYHYKRWGLTSFSVSSCNCRNGKDDTREESEKHGWELGQALSPRSWMALDECEDMEGQRYRGVELRLNFNALGRCNGITPDGGENSFCTIWTPGLSTYKPCLWKAQFTSATHWDFYLKGFSTSSSLFSLLDHLETYRCGWQRRPLTGVERTNKPSL